MLANALILFAITLAGIYLSCHLLRYEITDLRKVTAAAVFAVINALPIILPLVLAASLLALYLLLIEDREQVEQARKAFALTVVFAVIAVLLIYLPQQ